MASWIEKELKKRNQAARRASTATAPVALATNEAERMAELWQRIEAANRALPEALQLRAAASAPVMGGPDPPKFRVWFPAPNGAGLGFTGDAVRYTWPEQDAKVSRNFWLRWAPGQGYLLVRRVNSKATGLEMMEEPLDERRVEHLIKCLVTGKRVTPRSMRKKRFGLF
jgi:hypothetical protein